MNPTYRVRTLVTYMRPRWMRVKGQSVKLSLEAATKLCDERSAAYPGTKYAVFQEKSK